MNWPFEDLVDDPPPPPLTMATAPRGRPEADTLEQLTIPCHTKSSNTARFRCAGDSCHESWVAPHMSGRILPHASSCRYLTSELKELVLMDNAEASLSSKLELAPTGNKRDMFANFRHAGAENKAAVHQAHIDKINKLVVDLLCGALPLALVDRKSFQALVDHLEASNGIFVATTFSTNYIPVEAAKVTVLSLEKLKKCHNLTITYDGGSTKGHQSIYTIHVTTADREAHLIKGDEASGFSHTGEHIKKILLEV